MKKSFVGIDNGVTGSIGIITINGSSITSAFIPTPVFKTHSYTQKEQFIHRIAWREMVDNLPKDAFVLLERPMVDPRRFVATASALRALEATLIVLEMLDLEYTYIDSKEWQREYIGSNIIGSDKLKEASKEIGIKLFPNNESFIRKHGDADGLLIAHYAYKKYGGGK